MKWLVVLDDPDSLDAATDTTLLVVEEARRQRIAVDTIGICGLSWDGTRVVAHLLNRTVPLDAYDFIWMRKEPPYDMHFHHATQLLSLTGTPVSNDPQALRDYNEKLIALRFAAFMPPTIVSSVPAELAAFLHEHKTVIAKRLDTHQAQEVRKITTGEELDAFLADQHILLQEFLPEVAEGDTRVLLLGGEVLGVVLRKPRRGEYLANFGRIGPGEATTLTEQERTVCARIGSWCVERGLDFVGLDLIGGRLTEINITCPTGIAQVQHLTGENLTARVVRYFVERYTQGTHTPGAQQQHL